MGRGVQGWLFSTPLAGSQEWGEKNQAEFPTIQCDIFFLDADNASDWSQLDALRSQRNLPLCAARVK